MERLLEQELSRREFMQFLALTALPPGTTPPEAERTDEEKHRDTNKLTSLMVFAGVAAAVAAGAVFVVERFKPEGRKVDLEKLGWRRGDPPPDFD